MFRDTAAAVNAPPTPPPRTIDQPPVVSPDHRWRCPACRKLYRHPWLLAVHLVAADTDPERPGHGMTELDAWTTVMPLTPIDVSVRAGPPKARASAPR